MGLTLNRLSNKISKYTSLVPFLAMICNLVGFIIFFNYFINGYESNLLCVIDDLLSHLSNLSLFGLLLMFLSSKNYKLISWISLYSLLALWFINLPYILFSWKADIYFLISSITVYIIFIVFCLAKITKRI